MESWALEQLAGGLIAVLKGYGFCAERLLPYGTVKSEAEVPHVHITPEAFRDARKHRAFAYQRLYTLNDVKRALVRFAPLRIPLLPQVCFDLFDSAYSALKGRIPLPDVSDKRITGHAVMIVGYDDNERVLRFMNSWGRDWGDNGFGTLPYEYFTKKLVWRPTNNFTFHGEFPK